MADDPFDSSEGERTVFRPNPGGRRPQQPTPPTPAAPPPQTPRWSGEGGSAQQWRTGSGSSASDPMGRQPFAPAAPQSPTPRDEWGLNRPDIRAAMGAGPGPTLLQRSELIVPNRNPIMRAAGPMLLLLGRLRIALMRASFAELMEHVADSVTNFELEVRQAGIADAQVTMAKYVLCATADDIVQNIPAEDRHVWAQYSMLSRFFGERVGGVRFFEILDRTIADPTHNVELLELQHACLALGFQGRYRTVDNGEAALHDLQRRTYEVLKSVRPATAEDLSPRWRGLDLRSRAGRLRIPTWVVGSVVVAGVAALYLVYLALLARDAEAATDAMASLHPPAKLALYRTVPAPPPPKPPEPPPPKPDAPLTQLQRIRLALADRIATGDASADAVGTHIIVRLGANFLFASGKAEVRPEFGPLAESIAKTLEKEVGPILLIGHTDTVKLSSSSRFRSNFELSKERAKQVGLTLQPGLSQPDRVRVDGRGEQEPIADNATAEGRALNRRVEIWIDRTD
ncbi:MAG: type IVB secretion system protein IcmH/DotU [Siculibacillus sp.]|nr:type IVB secretion system protein IcmH/DotU [Siculibacillus sp.]